MITRRGARLAFLAEPGDDCAALDAPTSATDRVRRHVQCRAPQHFPEMGMPAEFETDFWEDANLCKTWDEIVPGELRPTIPYVLTLEAIQKYCQIGRASCRERA